MYVRVLVRSMALSFVDFDKHMAIVDKTFQFVLCHNAGWGVFDQNVHVIIAIHGCVEIKIIDVDGHEMGDWGGDKAVEKDFDRGEI